MRTEFDTGRAKAFRPQDGFAKTAILLLPATPAPVAIQAPFGEQQMQGPFYLVADEDGSYGAARQEFESTHRNIGPNRWLKIESVLAYQADERSKVTTTIGDFKEVTVEARPGDWIVRQHTGEIMVVTPAAFEARYVEDL